MVTELKEILSNSKGEGDISAFLTKHPELIRWAVCRTGGHCTYVIKQFSFGSKYKADFVVAFSYSGAWDVHFIELEPPQDKVITKAGLPSNRLNKAISQVHEWKNFIKTEPLSYRSDLSDWCVKKDLLGIHKGENPSNYTGNRLKDRDTHIWEHYHIIIGRRADLSQEARDRMNYNSSLELKIFTHDRLVDIAEKIEFANNNPDISTRITESEEE
jgi:hypothetical protein